MLTEIRVLSKFEAVSKLKGISDSHEKIKDFQQQIQDFLEMGHTTLNQRRWGRKPPIWLIFSQKVNEKK